MRGISSYLRRHHLGLIAIVIALSGSAVAATVAKNSVTSKSIKNAGVKLGDLAPDSVDSSKVVENSLTGEDILESSLNGLAGPVGPQGERGPQGETGPQGPVGPSTGPAGGDLAGAYPNPEIAAGKVGPDELAPTPAARVTSPRECGGSAQVIVSGVETPMRFDAEAFDAGNLHPNSCGDPGSSRLVAPRAGLYTVSAGVVWGLSAIDMGRRSLAIMHNGATHIAQTAVPAASADATLQSVSTLTRLAQGDFVDARVHQTSTFDYSLSASDGRNHLAMAWLGP